jgi:hypothetical protein
MASEITSTALVGSYGMPICPSRSGSALPRPIRMRPGAISSSELAVIASSTRLRVKGFTAPIATWMSSTWLATAEA